MDKKSEDKMREKFIETLYKLAHFDGRGPEDIDEDEMWPKIYKMFDELYGNTSLEGEEFRHYYSDIFIVISNINNEKQINEVKTNIDTLERRTQNYQKEYIAILSIFSAVVLAFIGGITFSVSVLQNVHEWDLLMGLSVVSLIGLVLSNILFLLFNFISNIINNKNKFIRDKYYISFNIIMLIILIVSLIKHFMV